MDDHLVHRAAEWAAPARAFARIPGGADAACTVFDRPVARTVVRGDLPYEPGGTGVAALARRGRAAGLSLERVLAEVRRGVCRGAGDDASRTRREALLAELSWQAITAYYAGEN